MIVQRTVVFLVMTVERDTGRVDAEVFHDKAEARKRAERVDGTILERTVRRRA